MGQYHFKLPRMGESVTEATVTKWLKQVGDKVILDDPIVEIATDKVDTDVTSEVEGLIIEQRFKENDVVQVGETLLVIETKEEIDSISLPVQTEKSIEPEKNKKSISPRPKRACLIVESSIHVITLWKIRAQSHGSSPSEQKRERYLRKSLAT